MNLKIIKLVGLISFFIIFSCNKEKVTKVISKWENGAKKVIHIYDSSKDTTIYTREFYYENGKIGSKVGMLNGRYNGKGEWWYENGNKKDEALFTNGYYIKGRTHWYENGKLKLEEFFDGKVAQRDTCVDSKFIYYLENGIADQVVIRKDGNTKTTYYGYADKGKFVAITHYFDTIKNGLYQEIYANGIKSVEGYYKYGKQDGKWIWWDSLGKIKSIEFFKEGEYLDDKR